MGQDASAPQVEIDSMLLSAHAARQIRSETLSIMRALFDGESSPVIRVSIVDDFDQAVDRAYRLLGAEGFAYSSNRPGQGSVSAGKLVESYAPDPYSAQIIIHAGSLLADILPREHAIRILGTIVHETLHAFWNVTLSERAGVDWRTVAPNPGTVGFLANHWLGEYLVFSAEAQVFLQLRSLRTLPARRFNQRYTLGGHTYDVGVTYSLQNLDAVIQSCSNPNSPTLSEIWRPLRTLFAFLALAMAYPECKGATMILDNVMIPGRLGGIFGEDRKSFPLEFIGLARAVSGGDLHAFNAVDEMVELMLDRIGVAAAE